MKKHWCPESEKITGGDALQSALFEGWKIQGAVIRQTFWLGCARSVSVYEIVLERENRVVEMKVLENPFVIRLLRDQHKAVVQFNLQKAKFSLS